MALLWVKWVAFLSRQPGASTEIDLVLFGTKRVSKEQWAMMHEAAQGFHPNVFAWTEATAPDEDESGYPRSANHLFVRSLEHSGRLHPGKAILWIETDCIPVKADWFNCVQAEYIAGNQPFMGVYVDSVAPHMTGCGVYPADWKEQSPALAVAATAPDLPSIWGVGKGQAWDTWAGAEIVPKMHRSRTIQQIWRPGTFTVENLDRVLPEAALFHQCKNGSLIGSLAHARYPEFLDVPAVGDCAYMVLTCRPDVSVLDTAIKFTPCARGPGGALFCVFKPVSAVDEALLNATDGMHGITRIGNDEYEQLLSQASRLRL